MEKIETPVNRLRRIFNESGTISDLDWQEAIEAEQIEMMTAVDLFVYHKKFTEDAFKTWYAENYDQNPSAAKPMLAEMAKCQSCGKNNGTDELHSCPYNADINNDDSPCCNCCSDCCHECAMDI